MANVASGKRVRFEQILLATDFSAISDRAFAYALELAARFGATLHLAHVVTAPMAGEGEVPEVRYAALARERQTAEETLAMLARDANASHVTTKTAALEGPLWPALESYIEQAGIDLIVAGTHGRTGLVRAVLGSSAEAIFRHAKVPVLVVGQARERAGGAAVKTIVYATDLAPRAAPAAEYAASLAQEFEAKLVLLHVAPPATLEKQAGLAMAKTFVELLKATVPESAATWAEVEYDVVPGKPEDEVVKLARKRNADLIVVGARPAGGLASRLPSTVHSVLVNATCPVLVVPRSREGVAEKARDAA
jgi:nucleotide-binding universal stress UspA family protein